MPETSQDAPLPFQPLPVADSRDTDQPRGPRGTAVLPCQNEKLFAEMGGITRPRPERPGRSEHSLGFVAELVFFDLAVKCGEPDIEQPGGFGLVTTGVVEHALDM